MRIRSVFLCLVILSLLTACTADLGDLPSFWEIMRVVPPVPTHTPTPTGTFPFILTTIPPPTSSVTFPPTLTPTVTLTLPSTASATASPTASLTPTGTGTATTTFAPSSTFTPTPSLSLTATGTQTTTGTATFTLTLAPTETASSTPTNTNTPTYTTSDTASATRTSTPSQTRTPTPTATVTLAPTLTASLTPTATKTVSPTFTPTATNVPPATATSTLVTSGCSLVHNSAFESQLLTLINNQRALAGLAALTDSYPLEISSGEHSDDMALNNYLSHDGLDGSTYWSREIAAGYTGRWGGEIIYAGSGSYNNPQSAVNWWMNDASHKAIILADYNDFGAGYGYCPSDSYGGFFTVDFGHR